MLRWAVLFTCLLCASGSSYADSVTTIGFLSYDVLIPGSLDAPGVNTFTLSNNTGDPTAGGFALPPDFPIFTSLTFLNATLTLTGSSGASSIALGDVGPGILPLSSSLEFPDTVVFSSAVLSGTLSTTVLMLSDGTTFIADSSAITATLLPASGDSLTPGSDFVLLQTHETVSTVPEPSSGVLLLSAVLAVALLFRWRRGSSLPSG